jgi:hypothetical protein
MPVLEIEKIYQKKEIGEYQKAIRDLENWRFIEVYL